MIILSVVQSPEEVIVPEAIPPERGAGSSTSTSTWPPSHRWSRSALQLPIWTFRSLCGRWLWRTPISDVMREVPTMSREEERGGNTHTHTHTHTQVCAPGGLRTDNSSSSHRGEKFCQRSHTSFIYYLFIVRNIYYGNVQDERSDEEPVHVRGHQESGAGGELLDVIQSLVRSDFLLLSTSRQVCLCPV